MRRRTRRKDVSSARASDVRLDPEAAREHVAAGAVLVDVRRQEDPTAALERAVRIAPDEMPGQIAGFLRDVPIVLACT